ncbi:baseplate assembly protein, partial [Enterobacter hormaechei]
AFQRVNDAVRAVFLASARGADLDQLGAAFNVSRLVINTGDPDAVPPVDPVCEDDDAFRERIQLSWAQLN